MSMSVPAVQEVVLGVQEVVVVSRGGPQAELMYWSQPPEGMPIQISFSLILLPHHLNK